jgi:chlorobactene glucosyltransferase
MMILSLIILFLLAVIFVITIVNTLFTPMLKHGRRFSPGNKELSVSVLIPARNEASNIKNCLKHLLQQDCENYEIIVLNDGSTDETVEYVQEIMGEDSRVKLVHGKPLPAGWTGKNWACSQLGDAAIGEILVFTDADITCSNRALQDSVNMIERYALGMLSVFPQQITRTWSEKLVVPTVYMFVYGYLPLWLTYFMKNPAVSAANGQWLVFTRECYERIHGHKTVRHTIAEDIHLARLVKSHGIKMLTLAGNETVRCRMYRSLKEVWNGFTKNAYELLSGRPLSFFILLLLLTAVHIAPYALIFNPSVMVPALLAVFINSLIRLIIAIRFLQPPLFSVFLHPVAILFLVIIARNSFVRLKTGGVAWKGRRITYPDAVKSQKERLRPAGGVL